MTPSLSFSKAWRYPPAPHMASPQNLAFSRLLQLFHGTSAPVLVLHPASGTWRIEHPHSLSAVFWRLSSGTFSDILWWNFCSFRAPGNWYHPLLRSPLHWRFLLKIYRSAPPVPVSMGITELSNRFTFLPCTYASASMDGASSQLLPIRAAISHAPK